MAGGKKGICQHLKRFFNFCAYGEAKQLAEKQNLNLYIYLYIYIYIDFFLNAFLTRNGTIFDLKRSSRN